MKRVYQLAIVLIFIAVIKASAQVEIFPASFDLGEIGTSLVNMNHWKQGLIRNASADTLILRSVFPDPLAWNVGEADAEVSVLSSGMFGPGDSAYLTFRLRLYGWGPTPFFEFVDTIWVGVRRLGLPVEAETLIPVPVYANVVTEAEPKLTAEKGKANYYCRCFIVEDGPGSSVGTVKVWVVNPFSPANSDTLSIDSLQIVPIGDNGIEETQFSQIYIYDSVGLYDFIENRYPPGHWQAPPVSILPGMTGGMNVELPHSKPGNKRTIVRAYSRRLRDGKTWLLQDTLQYYLGVRDWEPVGVGPGRDPIVMAPPLEVTKQDLVSLNKCGLPDATPLWADTVYIRGPRQDAIDLVKQAGSSLPVFPARLECFNSDVGYNIEVHRARTTPGTTVDTIVVEYHYDDPVNGRVDGIAKRPFTIIIEPRVSGVVSEADEPAGELEVVPNPAKDRIRFAWRPFGRGEAVGVRLFDALGHDVFNRPVAFELSGNVEIDVSGLPAGAYRAVVEGIEGDVLAVQSVMVVR